MTYFKSTNKILTMFVSANVFISYSKNMILLKKIQNSIHRPLSPIRTKALRNSLFGVMFLIFAVQCSYGDKKISPNEPANEAGNSFEDETKVQEEQTPSSDRTMGVGPIRGCIQGDCFSGTGTYIYDNDDEYKGSFSNDLRNGPGRMIYKNGDRFEGNFKDDLKDGKGTYIFRNGAILEGTFQMGKMVGPGKVRFPDTSIYEGEFQDEKNSIEGVMYSSFDHSKRHCKIENKIVLCGGPVLESGNIQPLH
ncbi:MORN repeat protein [Leptospira santarosai str. HAI134]|uniref:MORN repeat protein n=1 Tax=Leptospira santarosai serovar Arenal str. MAVJ 401 TaxID=1049976 RepID=M6JNE4_9LEPT|nr:MORN repeat protein [Leptospira santarosai serovar Arenal str. MAVJ 401]EMO21268.1 MORN repeat protein [Leptospira santarosai str. HAI134]